MEIGSNLKKLRTSKGMTQKDLADSLNVSSQAVSRWENNEVEPDISTLSKLSSIFEVPVDAIINGNFEKKEDAKQEAEQAAVLAGTIAAAAQTKSADDSQHICDACSNKKIKEYCYDCHKPLYEGDEIKLLNRKFPDGHIETQHICPECYSKRTGATSSKSTSTSSSSNVERKVIGTCSACGKTLYNTDKHHEINVPASTSHRRGHTYHHGAYSKLYCEGCNELRLKGKLNYDGSKPKYGKKRLVFGLIFGIATLIITMIVFFTSTNMNAAGAIFLPILLGYGVFAEIYCLFTDCYIGEVFLEVASWSVKFPGIIFTFDLDGFAFLIVMKILFAILGVFIGIAVFLLAVGISMALSLFTFPFVAKREAI